LFNYFDLLIEIELRGFVFIIKRVKNRKKNKREHHILPKKTKNGELFIVRRFSFLG